MDFLNFTNFVNAGLVGAVVVVIQTLKLIIDKDNEIDSRLWLIIVLCSGVPCAVAMSFIDGWVGTDIIQCIFNFIIKSFLYSASASLLYQFGKLSIGAIFEGRK